MELLIVDNSPDAAKAEEFAKSFPGESRIKFTHVEKPGLSNARNVGVELASAPIVAFVDDDVIASPGWLVAIKDAFKERKRAVGVVAGKVTLEWISERPKWLGNDVLGYLGRNDLGEKRIDLEGRGYVVGCNMAFSKSALEEAGGFSPSLGRFGNSAALLSNEEIEVSNKISQAGFACIYEPKAHVRHLVAPERLNQQWFRKRAAWQAVSDVLAAQNQTPQLQREAIKRLERSSRTRSKEECLGLIEDKATVREHRDDHQFVYDLVTVALLGGESIEGSNQSAIRKLLGFIRQKLKR